EPRAGHRGTHGGGSLRRRPTGWRRAGNVAARRGQGRDADRPSACAVPAGRRLPGRCPPVGTALGGWRPITGDTGGRTPCVARVGRYTASTHDFSQLYAFGPAREGFHKQSSGPDPRAGAVALLGTLSRRI